MISAVLVTYNSAARVRACLDSLRTRLPDAEIVVVDNGSQDESVAIVREAAPAARLHERGRNVGFGRAANTGAEGASGSHVLFLNPDTTIVAADETRLRALLERRPFGLVAPVLEDEPQRWRPETSWRRDYVAHTFGTLRPRELRPRQKGHGSWVSAALLLVNREEFLGLGGFDRRFFLYYEDRDLSRRYRDRGFPIETTDALRGSHVGTGSSAADDLRVAPMAWSLLGWLQYVAIHEGDRTARRAAHATAATLRSLTLALRAPGADRSRRAVRKRRQLEALLQELHARTEDSVSDFCPDALRALRPYL